MSMANTVELVDALERLSVDNHFQAEIDTALRRVHSEDLEFGSSKELYITSLRFRLLRKHGFWVSADVFDRFSDDTSNFSTGLSSDPRGLLSLYNAAHMAVPGEDALDNAISFTRSHLEAMKGKLRSPIAEQVSHALNIPLPRFMGLLETTHYIVEYEQQEAHDDVVLELARLESNLMRSVHLKELSAFSLWWMHLYDDVKLTNARDRAVEMYFWAAGVFPGEENSRGRMVVAKMIGLLTLMDDTYDIHATLDECKMLDKAIQRWDENAVSILPEYLRMLYIKILSNFSEFEDILLPDEKYRVSYLRKAYKLQSNHYLLEATWSNENYMPKFKEQEEGSVMTSTPPLTLASLMGAGNVATRDTFEWALSVPDMVRACAEIGRFLNDIASYKRGKNKMDVASTVECYTMNMAAQGRRQWQQSLQCQSTPGEESTRHAWK